MWGWAYGLGVMIAGSRLHNDESPLLTLTVGDYRRAVEDEARAASALADASERVQMIRRLAAAAQVDLPEIESDIRYAQRSETRGVRNGVPTWTATIEGIVRDAEDGVISYTKLKDAIRRSPLLATVEWNDKTFYRALGNLDSRGAIVRHNEHAFTPVAFAAHKRAVESGEREDVEAGAGRSTIGEAIRLHLADVGGPVQSRQIIKFLREHPDFKGSIGKNPNGVYNVLSRYVERGIFGKDEETKEYWLLEPESEHGARPNGLLRATAGAATPVDQSDVFN